LFGMSRAHSDQQRCYDQTANRPRDTHGLAPPPLLAASAGTSVSCPLNAFGPPAPTSTCPCARVALRKWPPLRPSLSGQYSTLIFSPTVSTVRDQPSRVRTLGEPFSNA